MGETRLQNAEQVRAQADCLHAPDAVAAAVAEVPVAPLVQAKQRRPLPEICIRRKKSPVCPKSWLKHRSAAAIRLLYPPFMQGKLCWISEVAPDLT